MTHALTLLEPRWCGIYNWQSSPVFIGLTFKCPHCEQRLGVMFDPPIDPFNLLSGTTWVKDTFGKVWQRTGDTFDTLTISPSINVEGHWHGHITNGEIQ